MTDETSRRHTAILNGYKAGGSRFNEWSSERLGNIKLVRWSFGEAEFLWDIDERFVMPDGVMFGGHIASVADHVTSLATMTVLTSDEQRFRTSRLETNYFRPLKMLEATIIARVTNASARLIHVEADFIDANDKLAARVFAVEIRTTAN